MKLHEKYEIYVDKSELAKAEKLSSGLNFMRFMVDKVFTKDALQNATPQGYPPRGKGRKCYKDADVLPRLHPDGFDALQGELLPFQTLIYFLMFLQPCCILFLTYVFQTRSKTLKERRKSGGPGPLLLNWLMPLATGYHHLNVRLRAQVLPHLPPVALRIQTRNNEYLPVCIPSRAFGSESWVLCLISMPNHFDFIF